MFSILYNTFNLTFNQYSNEHTVLMSYLVVCVHCAVRISKIHITNDEIDINIFHVSHSALAYRSLCTKFRLVVICQ